MFLFLAVILIIVSSCAKSECKASSDCLSKACSLSKCENKKCVYVEQKNCCGNEVKEGIENGKPGNKCTCPQDYGKCEGKGKIQIGSRTEDAAYAHYYCNADDQCVLGVEKNDVTPQSFLDLINTGFFKASSVAKFNKPFEISKDLFEFKITLDDINKDLILPIRITKVKLLYNSGGSSRSELLIADKSLDDILNGIGDQVIITTPLTLNYKPGQLEEIGSLRYIIDYSYTKKVLSGKTVNGTNLYNNETVRETFTSPSKQVFFVRSE